MLIFRGACLRAFLLASVSSVATAHAADAPPSGDILVVAEKQRQTIENAPSSRATVSAAAMRTTINAVNVEDTLKYLPSLIVRKRHIGDTQAPLATRTSGLGSSARSLVYADGVLLSPLIGNNNTTASPRWSLVSPQEITRIDILYGPFSAAYAGNSIGAVINITTRLPDRLEATIDAATNIQRFRQYGTHDTLPARQIGGTIGDRIGPLALFASVSHTSSNGQPLLYVTAAAQPAGTAGGYPDVNRTGAAIRVLGASGFEHQAQTNAKLKGALDITSGIRVTYVGGLFVNDTDADAETYLRSIATGQAVYTGSFSSGVYRYDERHSSHAFSATGSGDRFDWQLIGTLYDFAHDIQRTPTGLLPAARDGGGGTITDLHGTGWKTVDAKGAWRSDAVATQTLSFGAHIDVYRIASSRYATTDWLKGTEGALNLRSQGRTRTAAVWAQDAWKLLPAITLTVGGRYEWWKAHGGFNFSPPLSIVQPGLSAHRFSPKVSIAWDPSHDWTVRASFGEAYRFPTVGELYQIVTSPVPAAPNPNLKPERALSEELAIERHDTHGSIRLSIFKEAVKNALISQLGPLPVVPVQVGTFVQNIDRTRARGVELAVQRTDVIRRVDLSGSVTYADAETRKDAILPAAQGRLLPQVPHWKAAIVTTWRPTDQLSLTAAARYSSRNYGTIDNSDIVGNTYQGFYKYFVVDLRAAFRVNGHWSAGVGIDNVNNDKYFLFHPFPQRTLQIDLRWVL
jgi:iron complex outermembrane recepter protein